MSQRSRSLSVLEIAEICGVARSTVSYWIAKVSLAAHRSGKKYMVSVDDLVIFLKSQAKPVPEIFLEQVGGPYSTPFRPYKRCWEYWAKDSHDRKCQECNVFTHQVKECFTSRQSQDLQCPIDCHECRYFGEYYGPRVAFIHQMDKPAAVYKNLYLWSGNRAWADLCGVDVARLIGAGIEEFVHPDSLKMVISYNKRRSVGDSSVPDRYKVFFTDNGHRKIEVHLAITPLTKPSGTWLAVADQRDAKELRTKGE